MNDYSITCSWLERCPYHKALKSGKIDEHLGTKPISMIFIVIFRIELINQLNQDLKFKKN